MLGPLGAQSVMMQVHRTFLALKPANLSAFTGPCALSPELLDM